MKKDLKKYLIASILIIVLMTFVGCKTNNYKDINGDVAYFPIVSGMMKEGGIWNWLVYPMTYLMKIIGKIVNNNYALMILVATVVIRSIAWPIYGKTNDMSLSMSLMAPEIEALNLKYENKTDRESQQRKAMEQMQLYKKYKVSFLGCLMPFIQMPIFLAFYETLRRIPYSSVSFLAKVNNQLISPKGQTLSIDPNKLIINADDLKTKVFGVDLLSEMGSSWNAQRIGIIIIAVLVCATQIATQLLSQKRQNKIKNDYVKDVPEYRRPQQSDQQKQQQTMMKYMIYFMPIMMLMFVLRSPAALGWYWLCGNIYTALQTYISGKLSIKKMQKLKEKIENSKKFI